MNNLETRIKTIAANMDGNFWEIDGYEVPHSKFVEWDQTWTLFEGEDDSWHYYSSMGEDLFVTPDSTDEEIEEAILTWEDSHDEYYAEQVETYIESLREAKFSEDPDAFDEKTVDILFEAFSEGVYDSVNGVRKYIPKGSDEIRKAARKVLEQEAKDRKVRHDALMEARENDFRTYGHSADKWNRPAAEKCPVSLDEFDYAGGTSYMDSEFMTLEDAIRECMRKAYVGWFDENTIRM